MVYKNKNNAGIQPVYFVNSKKIDSSIIKTIDPNSIESINVIKEEIEIEGEKFYGKVDIKMKKNYNPEFISLSDFKLKYVTQSDASAIFLVDNEIIKGDYSTFIIDQNYILKVIVDKIERQDESLRIDVIRLLTKSEDNIKKSKEIRIRSSEGE